jgi:hypothetical protein
MMNVMLTGAMSTGSVADALPRTAPFGSTAGRR